MSKNDETIAEKQERLRELVAWFDSDDFEIEQASEQFTAAKKLGDEIEKLLLEQQNTITKLEASFTSDK